MLGYFLSYLLARLLWLRYVDWTLFNDHEGWTLGGERGGDAMFHI